MDVKIFLTADYANVDRAGKLNILGAFSQIHVRSLPARHPQMHIVMKLAFGVEDFGKEHDLNIVIVDPDGIEKARLASHFTVPKAKIGEIAEVNFVLGIRDLVFETTGKHEFNLILDDEAEPRQQITVNLEMLQTVSGV